MQNLNTNIQETKQKVAVFIGRFQPFHLGHQKVVDEAIKSKKYKHILFLIGSAEQARTPKNPFTFQERKKMIENVMENNSEEVQISILPLHDFVYDNQKWIAEVQNLIASVTKNDDQIVLIGNLKDFTSEYLRYFPHYESDFTTGLLKNNKNKVISATTVREKFFDLYPNIILRLKNDENYYNNLKQLLLTVFEEELNEEIVDSLLGFIITKLNDFKSLIEEYHYVKKYRQTMMEKLPYKNIAFFTGDALVTCAGHLLLVKRKIAPGKGLYALPGGFFDGQKDLTTVDTGIRELYEETKIKIPKSMIYNYIVKSEEFGDFNRSERWRIITKVSYVKLPDTTLPYVKGGDDAAEAIWMPFSEIKKNRDKFFEDHLSIIDTFLNIL